MYVEELCDNFQNWLILLLFKQYLVFNLNVFIEKLSLEITKDYCFKYQFGSLVTFY